MSADRLAALAGAQAHGRLSSAAAAVFDRTGVHWTRAVGENTDPDAQYRIGSVTKTFTAVLVMQAVRAGDISLGTPVSAVLADVGAGYATATVAELLGHTSGLQSEPVGEWWERTPGGSLAQLLSENDGSGRVSSAGEYHHYSNLGYALLGAAAEQVHGASWDELVSSRLLEPLALDRTTRAPGTGAEQGWSIDHFTEVRTPEPGHDTGAMAPAGQLWSTVGDLARWGEFLVSGHPDVLDAATLASMRVHVAPGQGLGVQLIGPHDRHLVGHAGSMPGFMAALFVDPVTGEGASFLCNGTTGVAQHQVVEQLLGRRPLAATRSAWVPSPRVAAPAVGVPGLWFWGNSAIEFRWHHEGLDLHSLATRTHTDRFELVGEELIGVWGYHRGERLQVTRARDGSVSHLECATFGYTRAPYA